MNEWISIADFKPEYTREVLAYRSEHMVCEVVQYSRGCWNIWNGEFFEAMNGNLNDITHWMPLPSPPEGV